jgi:hypothetical protein
MMDVDKKAISQFEHKRCRCGGEEDMAIGGGQENVEFDMQC